MDNFMNPQKKQKGLKEPDKPWNFIECENTSSNH